MFVGCSSSSSGTNTPTAGVLEASQWRACVPSLAGDYGDTRLSFNSGTFTLVTDYYASPGCTGTFIGTENSTGTYTLSNPNKIDYTYTGTVNTIYDIYEISGNTLKLGDRSGAQNGSSDANRPTSYNATVIYTKQ